MKTEDLPGTYAIMGNNQNAEKTTYKGTLVLALDTNKRVKAKWLIGNEQYQLGTGFFKDNILVINFNYKGDDCATYKGVVVYKCISKNILDGFWSEKHGDPNYLGEERCFRLKEAQELVN